MATSKTEIVIQDDSSKASHNVVKNTLIVYAVVIGATALLYLVHLLSSVVLQLLAALIIAVALEPLVQVFRRRRLTRLWSVIATMGIALFVILVTVTLISTPLITQGTKLIENAPELVSKLTENEQLSGLNQKYHIVERVTEFSQSQATELTGVGAPVIGVIGKIIGGISSTTIILVFAFLFLLEGPDIWERAMRFLSARRAARVRKVADKMAHAVGGFVTGNLLISVIAGVVGLVTLLALHVPYAFALAALLAIFDLVPLVGAALGTIILGLVALTQGLPVALIVVAVLLIYQLIEGHFIQPLVYSRVISLSPFLIILASIIGAELAGVVGVLLAIPVAAVLQIVAVELINDYQQQKA